MKLLISSDEILVETVPDDHGRRTFGVLPFPGPIHFEVLDAEFVEDLLRITATLAGLAGHRAEEIG